MNWSLLVGKFWGTEIRLHASLLLLIPYVLFTFHPDGIGGVLRVLLLIAAIFACVALHEMGHTVAARLYGIEVTSIVLWPLGGFANLSRRPEKVLPDLVIAAAGPLTNLLVFAGLLILTIFERILETTLRSSQLAHLLWSSSAFPFLVGLTIANLSLALFNLVPVYPLDGGQIARGILRLIFGEKHADLVMLIISLPLSLALAVYGFISKDMIVVLTAFLLILAGSTLNPRLYNNLMLGVYYFIDRGNYYLKRSDFDPALREFTRAIERAPERSGVYISRAIVFMNLLDFVHAKADTDRALALDKDNFVAWTLRGELLSLEKHSDAALEAYNHAITLRANWNIAFLDRGSLYQELGKLPQALIDMDRAVDLSHGSAITHLLRSILRYQMGDQPGSQRDADQALRYAPHWMLVFPEIFLLNFAGHLDWALDYYWRAIEHMPQAYQSFQGRADACRVNQRYEWAIADYNRAIHLAPRQAEVYLGRGQAYQQLGQADLAEADFQQAATLATRGHIRRQAQNWWAKPGTSGSTASCHCLGRV
jgi:Zn-dependent protease/Flp pilus assembly protein TadD